MTLKTEHLGTGAFLKSEGDGQISRESIVIASGAGALSGGTVLGKVTATGKYLPHDPTAEDGSETAAAVLFSDADASNADAKAVGVVRLAEVWIDRLVWGAGVTTPEHRLDALVDLSTAHVLAR